ncbi:hypothetical protein HDU91_003267 [Kappamyces sp. JEL0680]|nr:hypothetical protein HDU91_003267 [Kappamyces sp. JEL0680]
MKAPTLWKHLRLSGSIERLVAFLAGNINHPMTRHIRSLEIGAVAAAHKTMVLERARFLSLMEWFLQDATGIKRLGLFEHGSVGVLFGDPRLLLESVVSKCPNLLHLSVGGDLDSIYCSDQLIQGAVKSCPRLVSFHDQQVYGMTTRAIRTAAKGWLNLETLTLNCECHTILTICRLIPSFSQLRTLHLSHFNQSLLVGSRVLELALALGKLSLRRFTLDLHESTHLDGLSCSHWAVLLEHCPTIRHVSYVASLDSYYSVPNDPLLNREQVWTRSVPQLCLDPVPSLSPDHAASLRDYIGVLGGIAAQFSHQPGLEWTIKWSC